MCSVVSCDENRGESHSINLKFSSPSRSLLGLGFRSLRGRRGGKVEGFSRAKSETGSEDKEVPLTITCLIYRQFSREFCPIYRDNYRLSLHDAGEKISHVASSIKSQWEKNNALMRVIKNNWFQAE